MVERDSKINKSLGELCTEDPKLGSGMNSRRKHREHGRDDEREDRRYGGVGRGNRDRSYSGGQDRRRRNTILVLTL
jgi:hypothetical protein